MRLLHTADLHFGGIWNNRDRSSDGSRVLDEILGLCESEKVDLLVIAGDVFSDRTRQPIHTVARQLLNKLAPHMHRGLRIFMIRGNHDSLGFFKLLSDLIKEIADEDHSNLVVAAEPGIYQVPGLDLQVVAVPYLDPSTLRTEAPAADSTIEEQVVGLVGRLARWMQALYRQADPRKPAIFVGHYAVQGASLTPKMDYQSGYHRELWITADQLPSFTSYNALGHIHLGQQISFAAKPTWYSGAPDRQDLGEMDYTPQVLLVDLPDSPGGVATVQPRAITSATLFIKRKAYSIEEVQRICEELGDSNPLGEVHINVPYADRARCDALLSETAPRLILAVEGQEQMVAPIEEDGFDPRDVRGTVHDYLEKAQMDAVRRGRLLELFDALWEEGRA